MNIRSGMIRKLDEVGRIVIPKEIRKYLKLQDGSTLEIGINEMGEVILRSQYNISSSVSVEKLLNNLHKMLNKKIAIAGIDVVQCVGENICGSVSASIMGIMDKGVPYMASVSDKTTLIPILVNNNPQYNSIIVVPYMTDDKKYSLIAYGDSEVIDMTQVKLMEFCATLLK